MFICLKKGETISSLLKSVIAICCSSVKLFILLCIFSKESACMNFAFKSGFSR